MYKIADKIKDYKQEIAVVGVSALAVQILLKVFNNKKSLKKDQSTALHE
jgi:hypothetical protein